MNERFRNQWDQWFRDEKSYQLDINYPPWLERYSNLLQGLKSPLAIDLGCGRGFDTRFLISTGLTTISADYSLGALDAARKTVPSSWLLQFDLRDQIPFGNGSFGLIVANLSLHYFSFSDTAKIINELYRVLSDEGWLIARVNSTSDHGYESVKEDDRMRIEEDYYVYHGIPRRYFRETSIRQFFSNGWIIDRIEEKKLVRYEKPKALWEFIARKTTIIP
jgi:SAM-dependent methyltransferase